MIKQIVTADESWIVWCDLNNESESISKAINAQEITGSQKNEIKEKYLLGFAAGDYRMIVSKPKIAGFGLNFQVCHNVIFAGLSDSYEAFYQAIRRCWRFGQKSKVNCHIITTDIEGNIVENIKRKEADAQRMRKEMIEHMQDITKSELHEKSFGSGFVHGRSCCLNLLNLALTILVLSFLN